MASNAASRMCRRQGGALLVRAKIGASPSPSATPARGSTIYPAGGNARSDSLVANAGDGSLVANPRPADLVARSSGLLAGSRAGGLVVSRAGGLGALVANPRPADLVARSSGLLGYARSAGLLGCVRNGRSGGLAGNAVFSRTGLRHYSADSKKGTVQKDVSPLSSKKPFLPVSFEKLQLSAMRYWRIIKKSWAVFEGVVKVGLIFSTSLGGVVVYYSLNMSLYETFGLLQYLHTVKSAELKALVEAYWKRTANPNASADDEADGNPELKAALGAGKSALNNAIYAAKESARLEALADLEKKLQAAKELGRREAAEWINSLDEIKKRGV